MHGNTTNLFEHKVVCDKKKKTLTLKETKREAKHE